LKKRGVFEDLEKFSPKTAELLKVVESSKKRQFVYCESLEELHYVAECFRKKGYGSVQITNDQTPVPIQGNKMVVYAGSHLDALLETFNRDKTIQLFLASTDAVEGISLSDVTDVHLFDPTDDPTVFAQVVGRARRMCKNTEDISVVPHVYLGGKSEEEVYLQAEAKQKEIDRWLALIREASVDCALQNTKCLKAPFKARTLKVNGKDRTVFLSEAFLKNGESWTPLYERKEDATPVGYRAFDRRDEKELGDPVYYDRDLKRVEAIEDLFQGEPELADVRKKLKLEYDGGSRAVYVLETVGTQPLYQGRVGSEMYGYLKFGPPHIFFDKAMQKTTVQELF
jgi:hypothetical protein